jgi:flagellar hook-associated protein 1 FlgK
MGTLFSALSIAQTGLQAAQVQLDTAGHNIANVNKEGFSRQRVELVSFSPINKTFGQIGRGVRIAQIARVRDTLLDIQFRNQVAGRDNAQLQTEYFNRIEDIFLEPGENGLSGRINLFFESLQEFATNVESLPVRQSVMVEAGALATLFNETFNQLDELRSNTNEEVAGLVPEINSLAERIAQLNSKIRVSEGSSGNPANDLRDDRDLLVDQLAGIANVFVREDNSGQVEVLIGEQQLVFAGQFREVEAVQNAAIDPTRPDLVEIRFVDNGEVLRVSDGELFGALQMRDVELPEIIADLNELASTIIQQINLIHTQANGLTNLSGTVTASNAVTDPTIDLATAGLPFAFTPGTFQIDVFDNTGAPVGGSPFTVTIAAGDSLNDVATQINGVANLAATVNADGALEITSAPGFTFAFSNDQTGLLAALGTNALFTGSDAQTMGINQVIADDPALLGGAFSTDPADTGDNTAALALAAVQNGRFLNGGTATINDFYESLVVDIGIDTRAADATFTVQQTFVESSERRRQEISGVSLDEEVASLILFQRAFEASARVITVTDRMLESLLNVAL